MSAPVPPADEPQTELRVNGRVAIPRDELDARATRSGGPGGQHVNTSSTRIELRWNPLASRALSDEERERLRERLGGQLDGEGWLRIVAQESRSQRRNRDAAEERLVETVRRALVVPKKRKKTKPSRAAKERRLTQKKQRGEKKARRRWRGE